MEALWTNPCTERKTSSLGYYSGIRACSWPTVGKLAWTWGYKQFHTLVEESSFHFLWKCIYCQETSRKSATGGHTFSWASIAGEEHYFLIFLAQLACISSIDRISALLSVEERLWAPSPLHTAAHKSEERGGESIYPLSYWQQERHWFLCLCMCKRGGTLGFVGSLWNTDISDFLLLLHT